MSAWLRSRRCSRRPARGLWPQQIPDRKWLLNTFVEIEGYPRGQFTDDTQLSVATVQSLVKCGALSLPHVARSIARLWKKGLVIGPGGACTYAAHTFLRTRDWTTCGAPEGQAGNGTAMRTAVLGLFFLGEPAQLPAAAADVSRITHRDPRSIAGGVAIAKAAQLLANDDPVAPTAFCTAIAGAMAPYHREFADHVRCLHELVGMDAEEALPKIAWAGMDRPEFKQPIITPFVIPSVLASLWCVLRSPDSWSEAVARAIRLGGDVDTLGAIVGALAGTKLGVAAIPRQLVESVLDSEKLQALAVRYYATVASEE
jgi:ADP-ribosyl-[dinitrogen reductase] hydrolase